jgi:hypothetical protein
MSFTGLGELASLGESIITRIFPNADDRAKHIYALKRLEQEGDLAKMNAYVSTMASQIEVNKVEAASDKWWKAGWRPFVGWMCGIAFAYSTILEPLMRFVASVVGYVGEFPDLDTTLTMQVLLGMLGLAGMRSWDKQKAKT